MSELGAAFLGAIVGGLLAMFGGAWADERRRQRDLASSLVLELLPNLDKAADRLWEEIFVSRRMFHSAEFLDAGRRVLATALILRHDQWRATVGNSVRAITKAMPHPIDGVDGATKADQTAVEDLFKVLAEYTSFVEGRLARPWWRRV